MEIFKKKTLEIKNLLMKKGGDMLESQKEIFHLAELKWRYAFSVFFQNHIFLIKAEIRILRTKGRKTLYRYVIQFYVH